jgi:hypothetical protein
MHAGLYDPGGPRRQAISAPWCCLPLSKRRRLPRSVTFRGSITAACIPPVYASQPGLPPRHATLGSGRWPTFAGAGLSPAGLLPIGFSSSSILLSQALPGAITAVTSAPVSAPASESEPEVDVVHVDVARHLGARLVRA